MKDISPKLGASGLARGIGKDGQNGIQIKVLDSDDPATEEFIRKVLRENGQTKKKPGEVNKKPRVQSNNLAGGSETIDSEGGAAEIDHKEEPVFIKFINIENEDSEQDIIERILKSQNPESFYEKQDFLELEGDDSPWASLLKNSINTTQKLIDPNTQSSKFSTSAPKLVSSKSSATLVSSELGSKISSSKSGVTERKVVEHNVKKLGTLEEGPCPMRTPSLQEVESAISFMTLSPNEKPKARVVLDIIKTINSKSDEDRRRKNGAGVIQFSKSSADTGDSGDEVIDNNAFSSVKSSPRNIEGGKIVEHKDGFIVADSNGSEQDVRVQVLYLGEPETEAFIQSVLQMDESELKKNTKFTILKDSQDPQKDLQLEVIDNETLKKLVKYEQPIESSDVVRDLFNFENITKTTAQILKLENGKQKKQHRTQPSQNESKITILQGGELQKGRSNSLVSSSINQDSENQKISTNEKLLEIKPMNSRTVLGNRTKERQRENFKKIIIGVHKIDTIEAASSINTEEQRNPNTIKTNAKSLKEMNYSESVLELPKNSTYDTYESSSEIDQWLENTSQYETDSFSGENFITPQYQEEESFAPTEPQEDGFDDHDINSDGIPKALFFKTNYSTKPNYKEADEQEIAKENQDMFTAESSGYPVTYISHAPNEEIFHVLKAEKDNDDDLMAKNIKEDTAKTEKENADKDKTDREDAVKTKNHKEDLVKVQKYKQNAEKDQRETETIVKTQKNKDEAIEAAVEARKDKETTVKVQKVKEDSAKPQKHRNDALRAKAVRETAPKDKKSYGNIMRELGVTDQGAEDEEALIEAAMNFEQKHMVARSWGKKDKLKGIDQVAPTKTQVSFHLIHIV